MHKEPYYTLENIAAAAARMTGELPLNPRAAAFRPGKAALLVIDMQEYFLRPDSHAFLSAAPAILANVRALAAACRKASRPVLFTRHGNSGRDAGQMAAWWRELLARDHSLAAIDATLPAPGEAVIEKTQYDAFYETDLEARLRRAGIEQVLVTGVATHLCCESTARSAFARGFAVFIAVDGTATWNRELHQASLRAMAHACAAPLLCRDLLPALARSA
jgi:isochorismate hydrolase